MHEEDQRRMNKYGRAKFYLFFSILLLNSHFAFGQEYRLKFVPHIDANKNEFIVNWEDSEETREPRLEVTGGDNKDFLSYVTLHGRMFENTGNLLFENEPVTIQPDGGFTIQVKVQSDRTSLKLNKIDLDGNLKEETGEVLFPEWADFKASRREQRRWMISPGLRITALNYWQNASNLAELALSLKIAGIYTFPNSWLLSGSADCTVLSLGTNQSQPSLYLLNAHLEVGKTFTSSSSSWIGKILGGFGYKTTFSSTTLGYYDALGLYFQPLLEKTFQKNQKVSVYLTFTPLFGQNLNTISDLFSGEDLGGGLSYSFQPFQNNHPLSMNLELSYLFINIPPIVRSSQVQLGFNYGI
jgi:hypothetical protein